MLKRVLKNRVFCNESEAWDAEARLDVAQDICQALNIVDHFSDGDKWEVIPHESDGYVTVRNTSDDDYMDGLFCEVEIDNVWAKCFAAPNRDGGDYVLIGKVRWMARDLLDKVTALVGCGAECSIESRKRKRNESDYDEDEYEDEYEDEEMSDEDIEAWISDLYDVTVDSSQEGKIFVLRVRLDARRMLKVELYRDSSGPGTSTWYAHFTTPRYVYSKEFHLNAEDERAYAVELAMKFADSKDWFAEDFEEDVEDYDEQRNLGNRRFRKEARYGRNRVRKFESAVYSQKYADRAKELDGLKGQELFDALKPGDILQGIWGYNRTITDYFIVKRKTAKRVVVHQIERKNGDQPNDSWGGWSVCPVLPPKEMEREKDRQGTPDGDAIKLADYPKYLRIYKGDYGWENMD